MNSKNKDLYKFRPLLSENSDFLSEEPLGESLLESEDSFRVWVPKHPIIVLGRSQKAEKEINIEAAQADAMPIFKRRGGGGCVLLDEGCVCVAMKFPKEQGLNVNDYLLRASQLIQKFLGEEYQVNCAIRENYDLTYENLKFLGASLYMPREFALYYAVILIDHEPSMERIGHYLSMPSKMPEHRKARSHEDFLVPLDELMTDSPSLFREKLSNFLVLEGL